MGARKAKGNGGVPAVAPKAHVVQANDGEGIWSVRKSVLFLGAVALVYGAFLVITGQVDEFVTAMGDVSVGWVIAAGVAYLAYYALGVIAYVVAVATDQESPVGIRDLMSVEASGIFFSNLTPGGTGGAPAQIYRLTRAGLTVGGAGALQYTRFIIYEAGEGIFAALMLAFRLDYFLEAHGSVVLVGALLFGAKVVEVAGLLVICLAPTLVTRMGNSLLPWLARRGLLRRRDHWHHLVNEQVGEFAAGFRAGARNLRLMALTLLVTLVQLGFLYALPWFVAHAFGRPANLVTCLAAGSMLELLTSAVPLPGGTGGAEGGFALLFGDLFGPALPAGYVVWRAIEYVLPVLAAVPLLGLRSTSGRNVHAWLRHARAVLRRLRASGRSRGGGGEATIRNPRGRDR